MVRTGQHEMNSGYHWQVFKAHILLCGKTGHSRYIKYERDGGFDIGMDQLVRHLGHGLVMGIKG